MRSVIAFAAVALGVVVKAQELPQCAAEAVGDNFGDCSAIDIGCICANDDLLSDLACKVTESCSPEEIETLLTFARNLCEPQGVTLPDRVECPEGQLGGAGDDDEEEDDDEGEDSDNNENEDESDDETATVTDSETTADEESVLATGAAAHLGVTGIGFGAAFAGLLAFL